MAPTFVPDGSILTGQGDRLSDAILGEVDYRLSRRSTLTVGGSYGLLHFLTSGYIDSQNEAGQIGYGYQLDRKDTLGFVFYGDHFSFNGAGGSVTSTVDPSGLWKAADRPHCVSHLCRTAIYP